MAMLTDSNNVKTGILIGQPKKVAANTTEAKQGNVYGAINILLFLWLFFKILYVPGLYKFII